MEREMERSEGEEARPESEVVGPEGEVVRPEGEPEPPAPRDGRRLPRYLLTGAISGAVLLFALAFFMAGFTARSLLDEDGGGSPRSDGGAAETDTSGVAEHDPAWGPDDAPVLIQEFADFQCPYCGKFALQTYPKIKEAYGDQVRFVFRDFPLTQIHGSAQKAAEAAQCAADQGLFWEYHDLLFENQAALSESDLRRYAEDVGADTGEFNDCLDSGKNAREVLMDMQDGQKSGVSGTPAFLINGLLLSGAQPFEQFQLAIDQALASGAE
jgi:protein-disulfide isomerase